MTPKENTLELIVVCAFFVLLSLLGIVWDFESRLLTSGIDGIMLLFVCLMTLAIFGIMLLVVLVQAGLLALPGASKSKSASAPQGK
jgi:hypothetical protein